VTAPRYNNPSTMTRRIAITGLGAVSALGVGVEPFWRGLRSGVSGIGPISLVDPEKLQMKLGAEARDYDAADHFEAKRLALLDRFAQFAVVAAREAVADAGFALDEASAVETAVVIGTGAGGKTTDDDAFHKLYGVGNPRVHPTVIPRLMASAAASQVTMDLGLKGPAFTISSACASASHALGQALRMIQHGDAELALAGGAEACFTLGTLKAWESMRVVSPEACRPFSRGRRGMTLGEGAGVLALEPLEAAQARGAHIYAELAGFGMSADAAHLIQPSVEGAGRAIRNALRDSGLAPEQIGYVSAHGTGTDANDVTETKAIRCALGPCADDVAVSSTKSMHGHALGASGALEAIAASLALDDGVLPPTVGYDEADPACDLDYVPNQAREKEIEAALSNSFAFGGLNAVLALRRVG